MRLQYKTSFADSLAFQQTYHREFEKKATPAWFRVTSSLMLFAAIIALGYSLFPAPDRLLALYFGTLLIFWVWTVAHSRFYRIFAARYLKDSESADVCVVEIADGRYSGENRGIIQSFPLSAVSSAFERDGFVYIYFGRLGAARLPLAAFASSEQVQSVLALVSGAKKVPNQSPEPTATSVTPPAAQESRQP